jgi:sulfite dehydrogenase (quinone) subunit SoeB
MTMLPPPSKKKLGLVIDLDTCVGCHACAVACKEWNAGGMAAPLTDENPYGDDPHGVWFNRVHSYTVNSPVALQDRVSTLSSLSPNPSPTGGGEQAPEMTLHFPRSCLHCEQAPCVTVCPTGASYKRAEDGIVLIDEDKCIGCKLCSWACPYGAREYSQVEGVMKKCTLCVDRIYNEHIPEESRQPACVQACPTRARHFGDLGDEESDIFKLVKDRGGVALMPELGYQPVNRYLPPRARRASQLQKEIKEETLETEKLPPMLRWLDRVLSR